MSGNTIRRFTNTTVLAVCAIEAPEVVTSAEFDERLAETYARVRMRPGVLERLVGIRERRWWPAGFSFVDGAVAAGAKALSACGIDASDIGLMLNTSVSRQFLEPSTAVAVHHGLGLPSSCQNFDITNACLGFLNGMELGAVMIDSGVVDYVLVVDGEDSRTIHEATLSRLSGPETTSGDLMSEFAALTLGSGAVAMVLGRADRHPEGHRLVGAVSRAGTEHHLLCVGDNDMMRTDLKGLLDAGLQLLRGPVGRGVRRFRVARRGSATMSSTRSPRCTRRPCATAWGSTPGECRGPSRPSATSVRRRCRSRWPARWTGSTTATGFC